MSLRAPSATASAAAAVSALTLSTWRGVVEVGRDGRDDRDAAGVEQVEHGAGVDLDDVADEADVDGLAVDDRRAPTRLEQAAVLAGQADGVRAVGVEQPDELARDLAGEHHPHDVHRLGRGDAQAAAELRLDAEPVEHRVDLRAAAVHDDRLQADLAQEHHVLRERALEVLVDHGVAAVLHDDERARELLQPRQRLDEHLRLLLGAQVGAGVEDEVASCGVRAVLVDVVVREVVGPDGDHLGARRAGR